MQVISALILSSQRPSLEGRRERKAIRLGSKCCCHPGPAREPLKGFYMSVASLGKQVEEGQ